MSNKLALFLIFSLLKSLSFAEDDIDVLKGREELVKLRNDLKLEDAEKYFEQISLSIQKFCSEKRSNPVCSRNGKMPRALEEIMQEIRSCVPAATICSRENLDKEAADKCISIMERKCPISKPNETGHPNAMAKIIISAQERLPNLKFSSESTPAHLAEAYNKCIEEVSWGYSIPEKKKESKTKITSMNPRVNFNSDKNWISVGEYKTESNCFEALTIAKENKKIDPTAFGCRKRFSGKDVAVSVFEAKAMVKLSNYESLTDREITFSTLEKCNENISSKKKYKFPLREHEFDEVEIGPYGANDKMRFIGKCKEVKKVVCRNDENPGYSKIELWD